MIEREKVRFVGGGRKEKQQRGWEGELERGRRKERVGRVGRDTVTHACTHTHTHTCIHTFTRTHTHCTKTYHIYCSRYMGGYRN